MWFINENEKTPCAILEDPPPYVPAWRGWQIPRLLEPSDELRPLYPKERWHYSMIHCHIASLPTACTSACTSSIACNGMQLVTSIFCIYTCILIQYNYDTRLYKSYTVCLWRSPIKNFTACVYLMPFQVQYIRYTLRIRMCVVSIIPIHKSKATCLRTWLKELARGLITPNIHKPPGHGKDHADWTFLFSSPVSFIIFSRQRSLLTFKKF